MKEKYMNEAPIIIKQFLGYLQTIKGKSPKTVEEYYLDRYGNEKILKIDVL